ncbi:MAG: tRNA(adenine34) deaminase [Candidatus Azotimanducaceae bacterium]|jgi:tRNA(adenine34) deaminase
MKPATYWMQLALELAEQAASYDEVPVGAVVVQNGELIGQGFNQTISSHDPTAHAEIVALRDAARQQKNYRLPGAELYVTIEPCTMCAGALVHARISHLIFGAKEPRAGAICSSLQVLDNPGLNHRVQVSSGICESEAGQLMADFFKAKRKS